MENGPEIGGGNAGIPPNAVSLYGQNDAMDDFPVLKAFQKYIDAEQSKAQKRMTTLCIFFAIIMTIVIGVFVMLLMTISQRNNSLNDQLSRQNSSLNEQLIQLMLKERDRQQPGLGSGGNGDASMKALTDSVSAMQKQMAEQQVRMMEQQAKFIEQQAKAAEQHAKAAFGSAGKAPSRDDASVGSETAKLKKAHELLKAEKEKLAKEKEALRQKEVEMHRRKLYPEYYAKQDREMALAQQQAAEREERVLKPSESRRRQAAVEEDETFDDETIRRYRAALERSKSKRPPSAVKTSADDLDLGDDEDLDEFLEIKIPDLPAATKGADTGTGATGEKVSTAGWDIPLD